MSKGEELAAAFEQANNAAVDAFKGFPASAWQTTTEGEGWTVAALAHHVASGHEPIVGLLQGIAAGAQLPPLTPEALDQQNASNAAANSAADSAATIALMTEWGPKGAAALRSLSDADLAKTATIFGNSMSASDFAQGIMIGHVTGHLKSLGETGGKQ